MQKVCNRLKALLAGQKAVGITEQRLAQRSGRDWLAGNHVEVIRRCIFLGCLECRQTVVMVQINQLCAGQGLGDDALRAGSHFGFLRLETVLIQIGPIDRFRRCFCTLQSGQTLDILKQLLGRHVQTAEHLPPRRFICAAVEVE
ncbi:hypothetical protein D3C75_796910 [compost metagenome]